MNIITVFRDYSATDSIKSHVESSLGNRIGKYFQDNKEIIVRVVLAKEAYLFTARISIHEGNQEFIKVSKSADTVYKAVDCAASHIAEKLQKYKDEKIHKYRKGRLFKADAKCKGYTLSSKDADDNLQELPKIIEEEIPLKRVSVSEAVMEMELLSVPALLFINSETEKINMLYIRDGGIILVDPLEVVSEKS